MTRKYYGLRNEIDTEVLVLNGDDVHPLDPRLDLVNHSPTGLEWGYGGSGPAQLALALLCDALEDDARAQDLYQDFKYRWVAALPQMAWVATRDEILEVVREIETERRRHATSRNAASRPDDLLDMEVEDRLSGGGEGVEE